MIELGFREDLDLEDDEEIICPICGSDRLSSINTYQATIEINIKTKKVIKREKDYEKSACVLWHYKCRKCNWKSEVFTE